MDLLVVARGVRGVRRNPRLNAQVKTTAGALVADPFRIDVVRLALEGATTRDGGLPVESGPATFQAARDLLLAAAGSAVEPNQGRSRRQ